MTTVMKETEEEKEKEEEEEEEGGREWMRCKRRRKAPRS